MSEMKSCPFCRSRRNRVEHWDVTTIPPCGHTEYAVMCENCGCFGPNEMNPQRAVDMWNLRRESKEGAGVFDDECARHAITGE